MVSIISSEISDCLDCSQKSFCQKGNFLLCPQVSSCMAGGEGGEGGGSLNRTSKAGPALYVVAFLVAELRALGRGQS